MTIPPLFIGANASTGVAIAPRMANRHGLIAGATGTGKTITLQVLAQAFSAEGVPVLVPDIKGDFSGIAKPGVVSEKLQQRAQRVGIETLKPKAAPAVFWDVYGEKGHPLRLTISELGPQLLSRLLGLNETQSGIIDILFRVADDLGNDLFGKRQAEATGRVVDPALRQGQLAAARTSLFVQPLQRGRPLLGRVPALDDRHRAVARRSGSSRGVDQPRQGGDAHQHDGGDALVGERGEGGAGGLRLTVDHVDPRGHPAMRHGDPRRLRHGDDTRQPGDDVHRDSGGQTRRDLFAAASVDERITALEPDDALARAGEGHQELVDPLLQLDLLGLEVD